MHETGEILATATWDRGTRSSFIQVWKDSFEKTELLDLVLGHEFMHAKFNAYFGGYPTKSGGPRTNISTESSGHLGPFSALNHSKPQHDVIYSWMHLKYNESSRFNIGMPRNNIYPYSNYWNSPVTNPY